jgi:hypothetical protein
VDGPRRLPFVALRSKPLEGMTPAVTLKAPAAAGSALQVGLALNVHGCKSLRSKPLKSLISGLS